MRAAWTRRCAACARAARSPRARAAKLFPPIVIHLIASGEATGRLDTMLAAPPRRNRASS